MSASVTTCHMTIVLPGIGPICEHGTFEHVLRPSSSLFPRQTLTRPPVHHMYIILLVSYVEQSIFSFISSSIRHYSLSSSSQGSTDGVNLFLHLQKFVHIVIPPELALHVLGSIEMKPDALSGRVLSHAARELCAAEAKIRLSVRAALIGGQGSFGHIRAYVFVPTDLLV